MMGFRVFLFSIGLRVLRSSGLLEKQSLAFVKVNSNPLLSMFLPLLISLKLFIGELSIVLMASDAAKFGLLRNFLDHLLFFRFQLLRFRLRVTSSRDLTLLLFLSSITFLIISLFVDLPVT